MSFKSIKKVLSRDEMKKIMAGSGECGASTACGANYPCVDSRGYCSFCCLV